MMLWKVSLPAFLCAYFIFFNSNVALAEELTKSPQTDQVHVTPKACTLDKDELCKVDVYIRYINSQAACLFANNTQLTCFDSVGKTGEYLYYYQGKKDLIVEMVGEDSQRLLSSAKVKILQLKPFSKFKRRRQRNPWSLF